MALVALSLSLLFSIQAIYAFDSTDTFIRATVPDFAAPNESLNISGLLAQAGNTYNFTCNITISNSTNPSVATTLVNASNGSYSTLINAPLFDGLYNVTITTNYSSMTIPIEVDNFQDAAFSFVGSQPPYFNGTNVTLQVTAMNTTGSTIANESVNITIYEANGEAPSWGSSLSNMTTANGVMTLNITIPANATPGTYIIDTGAEAITFVIRAFTVSVFTQTTDGEDQPVFGTGESVSIVAKLRDSSGNSVTGATVRANVTYPNGTAAASALSMANTSAGTYKGTFTATATKGTYTVEVTAVVGSATETSGTAFVVDNFRADLVSSENKEGGDFFFDFFGNEKAVPPGSNVSFDLRTFNISSGSALGVANQGDGVICNSITMNSMTNVNGTAVANTTIQSRANTTKFSGVSICSLTFNTSATAGSFRVNVTIPVNASGSIQNITGVGFFTTQNFLLSVEPIALSGQEIGFAISKPGDNTTLKLSVRNVTSRATLSSGNISSANVTSLSPTGEFNFGSSTTQITTGLQFNYNSADGTITLVIPSSISGPTLVNVRAALANGEVLEGIGFLYIKSILGFISPPSEFGEGGGGGGPGDFGGETFCGNGVQISLRAFVVDPKDFQALPNVLVGSSAPQIIHEDTGTDISGCFSFTPGASQSNSGTEGAEFSPAIATVTLTPDLTGANCTSLQSSMFTTVNNTRLLSGDYLMLWPVQSGNVTDTLPGFLECVVYAAETSVRSSSAGENSNNFGVGPRDNITITISNAKLKLGGTNINLSGNVTLTGMFAFDPSSGEKFIDLEGLGFNATLTNGSATINVSPASIASLPNSRWLSGFQDFDMEICDSTYGCSTVAGAEFNVISFMVFPFFSGQQPSSYNPSQVVTQSFITNANVTNVTINRFEFGRGFSKTTIGSGAVNVNGSVVNMTYGPASGFGQGFNMSNVTFIIPANTSSGDGFFDITFTSNTSDTAFTGLFAPVTAFVVISPTSFRADEFDLIFSFMQQPPGPKGSRRALSQCNSQSNLTINTTAAYHTQLNFCDSFDIFEYVGENVSGSNVSDMMRWNLTYLNITYNASSKTGSRGVSAENISITGFGSYCMFQNPFNVNQQLIVMDNATAGVYNTVCVKLNGTIGNGSNVTGCFRTNQNISQTEYIASIDGCTPRIFSTSSAQYDALVTEGFMRAQFAFNTWRQNVGDFRKGENITIGLYLATNTSGGTPQTAATIGVQNAFRRPIAGYGVGQRLLRGTDYNVTQGTTDSNGVGFITINQSTAATDLVFWNITLSSGRQEAATFSNLIELAVRSFRITQRGLFNNDTNSTSGGFFEYNATGVNNTGIVVANTTKVGVRVCAEYFNGTRIIGANVSVPNATQFLEGPPSTKAMSIFNSSNSSQTLTNATTIADPNQQDSDDSNGCATFLLRPTEGSWSVPSDPRSFTGYEILASVTATVDGSLSTENDYLFFAQYRPRFI
ncbi:MAG: hypothetical protein HY367_04130 [Candidatus Aenigmarchaeota archaeon]|nr:hypothetical protein [Candidatus Aenigmarchaeota archaeon]